MIESIYLFPINLSNFPFSFLTSILHYAHEKTMKPAYDDASTIPYLLPAHCTRLKMTNTRKKQLLKAANRDWDQPPPKPANDECCGSNCTPCVKDLWKEDVLVWKQRWGTDKDHVPTAIEEKKTDRIPGSYEW